MSTPPSRVPDLGDRTARQLLRDFATIDTDRDGAIEPAEIDRAIANPRVRGATADAVVAVKTNVYDRMVRDEAIRQGTSSTNRGLLGPILGPLADEGLRRIGVTRRGMTRADLTDLVNNPRRQASSNELDGSMDYAASRRAATPNRNAVFNTGFVSTFQVSQGSIGDCYYLAAVASYAHMRGPELRGRIQPNRNGGATIRFGENTRITVSAPTDGELGYMASSRGNGTWLTLMEKAYGQLRNNQAWFGRTTVAADAADGGGLVTAGIKALTGHGASFHLVDAMSLDSLRGTLTAAVRDRRIMTAGTSPWTDNSRVVGHHVYSVLHYDRRTDTVTLRNPWGTNTGRTARGVTSDGFVRMSLAQFRADFNALGVENAR